MTFRLWHAGIVAALVALPTAVFADEAPVSAASRDSDYYSGLEELALRRNIADLSHGYVLSPDRSGDTGDILAGESPYLDFDGGSAGGYVSFGGPATSTFLGSVPVESDGDLLNGVEFGVDWRPDVSGVETGGYRRLSRGFTGSEIDRVGVRADLTALLRDEFGDDGGTTAWRVTGMLGSTSLSLLSEDNGISSGAGRDGGGLLWDIGVGWSSGAVSVNAGYQSAYSFGEFGEGDSAMAILTFGADYAILPGLSVFGEFNVIDGLRDSNETGLGTVIIVGTGVSF